MFQRSVWLIPELCIQQSGIGISTFHITRLHILINTNGFFPGKLLYRVNEFLGIAAGYDGYVFGSPVHWGAAGGSITSFMDRVFFADFCGGGRRFQHKPAACVVSARREGTTASLDQMHRYFSLLQMPIVTARYWNAVHGTNPDEVREDREGMQNMRYLGRNMA